MVPAKNVSSTDGGDDGVDDGVDDGGDDGGDVDVDVDVDVDGAWISGGDDDTPYSTFWACSRSRSISALSSTTR
jgi:hypothetical protein